MKVTINKYITGHTYNHLKYGELFTWAGANRKLGVFMKVTLNGEQLAVCMDDGTSYIVTGPNSFVEIVDSIIIDKD